MCQSSAVEVMDPERQTSKEDRIGKNSIELYSYETSEISSIFIFAA